MAKVFVSGCYDMLHSGHVAFFEEAATYGDLYVGIGSDATIEGLKGRKTINTEAERLYMVKALRCVKDAWINRGHGLLDFEEELRALKPDVFFVNTDGWTPAKAKLCDELGIRLVVAERRPHPGLPARSTTALRKECTIPYRVELCGGWLDQPFVNALCPGPVLTISIEPDYEYNDRSGLASSSRKKAIELWQTSIPEGDREKLARVLFCMENPPGTKNISGSQDQLGILLPGLNRLDYEQGYWPAHIESRTDEETLRFVESHIWMVALPQRDPGYDVLGERRLTAENAAKLSRAAKAAWAAIEARDLAAWGAATTGSYEAEIALFPRMETPDIRDAVERYRGEVLGWKLTGCGGGGYLVLISDHPVAGAQQIRICRS